MHNAGLLLINYFCVKKNLFRRKKKGKHVLRLCFIISHNFNFKKLQIKIRTRRKENLIQCYHTVSSQSGKTNGNFTFSTNNCFWWVILDQFFRDVRFTAQKMKFSIKDFSSKCDQIHKKLRIWSHLLEKSLMENFIFCTARWAKTELSTGIGIHTQVWVSQSALQ